MSVEYQAEFMLLTVDISLLGPELYFCSDMLWPPDVIFDTANQFFLQFSVFQLLLSSSYKWRLKKERKTILFFDKSEKVNWI